MPVITVSRQYGAGGTPVSRIVAERLGYTLINKEILALIAEKANVSHEWVKFADRNAGDWIMHTIPEIIATGMKTKHPPGNNLKFDEETYRRFLTQTMQEIAGNGRLVILGRGGPFILRHEPQALHVHLIADEEDRIRSLMQRHKWQRSKAEEVVRVDDKKREQFLKGFQVENPNDPIWYHLTLNTGQVDYMTAADLICDLFEQRTAAAGQAKV